MAMKKYYEIPILKLVGRKLAIEIDPSEDEKDIKIMVEIISKSFLGMLSGAEKMLAAAKPLREDK